MWTQFFPFWVHIPSSFSHPFWCALYPPCLPNSLHPLLRALSAAFMPPHHGLEAPDKVPQEECVCLCVSPLPISVDKQSCPQIF